MNVALSLLIVCSTPPGDDFTKGPYISNIMQLGEGVRKSSIFFDFINELPAGPASSVEDRSLCKICRKGPLFESRRGVFFSVTNFCKGLTAISNYRMSYIKLMQP